MKILNQGSTITHIRGDSGSITIGTMTKGGQVITNYTAVLSIKKDMTDTNYALQVTAANGQFTFLPSATASLQDGEYAFDIQITLPDETVYTPLIGNFKLLPDVTRG